MEIDRLHEMLTEAHIEHEYIDRTPPGSKTVINWGRQVVVYEENGDRLVSAIEGYGTYGYMNWLDPEHPGDLIEIMGLLTPEEAAVNSVVGYLTAENVFDRIKRALEENTNESIV